MTILIAATLLLTPIPPADARQGTPSDALVVGAAAFYDKNYDAGGWDAIISARRKWGQLPDDFEPSPEGFWCAHPDLPFGTKVHVQNAITGEAVTCVVADRVAKRDVARWRAQCVIEMSYNAFVAAGGQNFNRFVVVVE